MVALIATVAYPYAGRSLSPGDTFEASEKDATLLKLIGRAKDAPIVKIDEIHAHPDRNLIDALHNAPASRQWQTRDLAAEGDTPDTDSPERPKRVYRRRDLTPEQP